MGSGPENKKLKELSFPSKNIFFLGNINNIQKVYQVADYFVSASYSEGLPNSVLEAMSSGITCILSDIPMHRELYGEEIDMINFNPNSVESLYKAFKEAFVNEDNPMKYRNHIIQTFSSIKMSSNYHNMYIRLINGK